MTNPADPWLIVGLGNPGPQYETTRHNVGQMVLDELADRVGGSFSAHKVQAAVLSGVLGPIGAGGQKVVLAKPTTYMNVSGGPVSGLCKYYNIPPSRVIMVHDELDVDFGRLRLKCGGGEGGHNGLRDTTKALGTKDYFRIRVGIGRPPGRMAPADFVLRPFSKEETKNLPLSCVDAADAVEDLMRDGLVLAQQRWHSPN